MKLRALIFNDFDLEVLLSKRKNLHASIKSLITYFLTLPRLNSIVEIIFLPQSILSDDQFISSISNFLLNNQIQIGISINTKFIKKDEETPLSLDYYLNPFPEIEEYLKKYQFSHLHISPPFGKRRIQKSPKHDEYSIHSQFNWTNTFLIHQLTSKQNIQLWMEPNLYFYENSSEDFYIHMRQILIEGSELSKKLGFKFNQIKLIIPPFYPKLKGLKDIDILDPGNIANTTLRCLTECLTKDRMEFIVKPCKEFTIYSFKKYIKFIKTYGKDISIDYIITADVLKDFIKTWEFQESNLQEAQTQFYNELTIL